MLRSNPLAYLIMPAILKEAFPPTWYSFPNKEGDINISFHFLPVPASDAIIHYCDLSHSESSQNPHEQRVIIQAVGNADYYENHISEYIEELMALAKDQAFRSCHFVGFNFRGVMQSTGSVWTEQDWVNDVLALVEHFRSKGIPLENILLRGQSLGGAIMTLAAAQLYEKEQRTTSLGQKIACVKLINERSFSSLPSVVATKPIFFFPLALLIYGAPLLLLGLPWGALLSSLFLVGSLCTAPYPCSASQACLQPITTLLLKGLFGPLNAAKAYASLPSEAVTHLFVLDDEVIPFSASLHRAVQSRHKALIGEAKQDLPRVCFLKDTKLKRKEHWTSSALHCAPLQALETAHKKRPSPLSGDHVLRSKITYFFSSSQVITAVPEAFSPKEQLFTPEA